MAFLSVERTLLNIDHYKSFAQEHAVFESLHSNLGGMFLDDDEADFLLDVFDAQWLEENFFLILEDVLAYTAGEQDGLTASIDLSQGEEAMRESVIFEMMEMEGMSSGEAEEFLDEEMILEEEIFTEISLDDELDEDTRSIFLTISNVRQYFPIVSYILLGLILIFMCLLAKFAGGFKWFGTNMLLSGFLFFITLLGFSSSLSPAMLTSFLNMPAEFDFVTSLLRTTLSSMMIVPLVYGLIGLAFIVIGSIWSRSKKKKAKKVEPQENIPEVKPEQTKI